MYNCSTNHSLITINWYLNKTVSAPTFASYGVTAPGVGTPVSSLTIPGLVKPFNNTEVLCYASGPGFGDVSPPPVILRIQGRLETPNNVTALHNGSSCCYNFNWSPPFTLPGVPILGYNIDITNNKGNVLRSNVSNTTAEWEYCPEEFGDHIISVAAVNDVGEGTTANTTVIITESKYSQSQL